MKKINIRKIALGIFTIFLLCLLYIFLNYKDLVYVYSYSEKIEKQSENMQIVLGGEAVGIKLLATGVLVMQVDREDVDIKVGDIILSVNDEQVDTNAKLQDITKNSKGEILNLKIKRQEQEKEVKIEPVSDEISGEYVLGLWVKDSSAGVGTVTFYDKKTKKFASLGHGVTETKENYVLPIQSGGITSTNIFSIEKGYAKQPGQLRGTISNNIIGDIMLNTKKGVYGFMLDDSYYKDKEEILVMKKTEIKEGKAKIRCTLDDNKISEYDIEIEKVLLTSTGNKNMIIKITDEELLNKTNGIIQGMSGSPIIQDNKLVGAITHVFLNDPTRGYAVFAENMIEDINSFD